MSGSPLVAAVVPIHNGREETLAFLESMARVTYPNLIIIVVDDGSTDGSAAAIADRFPRVTLLSGDGDLWWSGATNLGVEEALARGADFVLAINNDNVVTPGFIEPLVETARRRPRSLVTSLMYDLGDPGVVCSFGGRINWLTGEIRDYTSRRDRLDLTAPRECDWVHGSSTLVPADAFRELGLFDREHYPLYHADAEFSLRARRRGYRLVAQPLSVVFHRTERSAGTAALNRARLRELVTGIRSPFYLTANARLYRDWCPFRPFWIFFGVRYLRLCYSLVRRRFVDRTRMLRS